MKEQWEQGGSRKHGQRLPLWLFAETLYPLLTEFLQDMYQKQ